MTVVRDVSFAALAEQGIIGDDARQVRTFAAFLGLPENDEGQTVCSPTMHAWALGGDLPPDDEVAKLLGEDA